MPLPHARASAASNDRTSVVNLYMLLLGAVTGVSGNLIERGASPRLLSILFFMLSLIGGSFVFKLIRLRQAWDDSAKSMNVRPARGAAHHFFAPPPQPH
jgi:hypothetical protein